MTTPSINIARADNVILALGTEIRWDLWPTYYDVVHVTHDDVREIRHWRQAGSRPRLQRQKQFVVGGVRFAVTVKLGRAVCAAILRGERHSQPASIVWRYALRHLPARFRRAVWLLPGDIDHSFSLIKQDDADVSTQIFSGLCLHSLTLSFDPDGVLFATAQFWGRREHIFTQGFDDYRVRPAQTHPLRLSHPDGYVKIKTGHPRGSKQWFVDAASVELVQLSFTRDNMRPKFSLDSISPQRIVAGTLGLRGRLQLFLRSGISNSWIRPGALMVIELMTQNRAGDGIFIKLPHASVIARRIVPGPMDGGLRLHVEFDANMPGTSVPPVIIGISQAGASV